MAGGTLDCNGTIFLFAEVLTPYRRETRVGMAFSTSLQGADFTLGKTDSQRRFQIPLFFFQAYLIAWLLWIPTVLKARGITTWEIPGAETFGLFGSSLAAIIVAGLTEGGASVKQLLGFMVRMRMNWAWALVAILLPLSLNGIGAVMGNLTGNPSLIGIGLPIAKAPLYFISQIIVMLLTEEPGWRGFILPRLQERLGLLRGSLVLGVLWGLWHLPLFLIPGRPQGQMPLIGFVLATTAATVLMAWVQRRAGSAFVSVLFHAAMTTGFSALGVLTSGTPLFWITTAVWVVVAAAVYLVTGLRGRPEASAQRASA